MPELGTSSIGSEQAAESLDRYDLGTLIRWSFQRYDSFIVQTLVTAVHVIVIKILENRISRRLFAQENQSVQTL